MADKRRVYVTAYPNIAPAGTAITKKGEGTNWPVAIGRAWDAIFADDRMKGKRLIWPIKCVVTGDIVREEVTDE